MSEIIQKAKAKIDEELKNFKGNGSAKVVSNEVAITLKKFCENEKFAQTVISQKKTFSECCAEIVKNAEQGISDIKAYRKAAEFYFPGAKIDFKMEITVEGELLQAGESNPEPVSIKKIEKIKAKKQSEAKSDMIQISLF